MELPRLHGEYVIIRIDGKNFSRHTKSLPGPAGDPFNHDIYDAMIEATTALVKEIDGAVGAYTVSDEISVLIDMTNPERTPWYDGRVEKILSVSASIATAHFNQALGTAWYFDSKVVFTSPDQSGLREYFFRRHHNGYSNAISTYASKYIGHRKIHGLPTGIRQQMLTSRNIEAPSELKNGELFYRKSVVGPVTFVNKRTGEEETVDEVTRNYWVSRPFVDTSDLAYMLDA